MKKYQNPIMKQKADPWIYKHTDGYYYFSATVATYDYLEIRRAKTIEGLKDAQAKVIWHAHENGPLSNLIWAPEIHYLDNKWYLYFSAAPTIELYKNTFQHRMFVLECSSDNPIDGEWIEKGQVKTMFESFSLDASIFTHNKENYYVWAQKDPNIDGHSNIYLAKMINPWTIESKQILLSRPEYDWENIGFKVNEGPAALIKDDKIFITYSASATDENYAVGLLWANLNDDLMDGYSWHKSKEPVFKSSIKNKQYGPGHNGFTKSEDGLEDIIVYHAREESKIEGDSLQDPGRHTRVQTFTWDENGFPIFGEPIE